MPMQLPKRTFLQVLLSSSNIMTCRQIGNSLFPSPSTIEDSSFGVAKAPLKVWDNTIVGALSTQIVWI